MNRKVYHLLTLVFLIAVGCSLPLQQAPPQEDPAGKEMAQTQRQLETSASSSAADSTSSAEVAATTAPVPANEQAASAQSAEDAPQAQAVMIEQETLSLEILDLAADDETFLETISRVKGELGDLLDHRYVEFVDDRGVTWQGEGLAGGTDSVLLLQPMQGGRQQAVRISLGAGRSVANVGENVGIVSALSQTNEPLPDPSRYDPPNAEIQFVRARQSAPGLWTFDVRLNHPDTGWEDYTDGWQVEITGDDALEGRILATRILLHPHETEMPFSRSQSGIEIPAGVTHVQVRSHDLVSGYTQETVVVPINKAGSGEKFEVIR